MTERYRAPWYSIELLPGWSGQQDEECHSFVREDDAVGALQISGYRKDAGTVTEKEIKEFGLKKHIEAGRAVQPAIVSTFRGFRVSYVSNGTFWREWHIYTGRLLLFVTYNCSEDQKGIEDDAVEGMLQTLKPIGE